MQEARSAGVVVRVVPVAAVKAARAAITVVAAIAVAADVTATSVANGRIAIR
jgi:hypothetical protein